MMITFSWTSFLQRSGFPTLKPAMLLLCAVMVASCGRGSDKGKGGALFPYPEIPAFLKDETARTEYEALHFWDRYPFADTSLPHISSEPQRACRKFVLTLQRLPSQEVRKALDRALSAALLPNGATTGSDTSALRATAFAWLHRQLSTLLYDPNSPLRDEELYMELLYATLYLRGVPDAEREQASGTLKVVKRNRPGTAATNFVFAPAIKNKPHTAFDDHTESLYNLRSDYLILMFINPFCAACREVTDFLRGSPVVKTLLEKGTVKVLALYPDEDTELWNESLPQMPENWIHAYDPGQQIRKHLLYDLRAIPTLYLLDRCKTVMYKDIPAPQLEQALIGIINLRN